jgi:hypothetical protein
MLISFAAFGLTEMWKFDGYQWNIIYGVPSALGRSFGAAWVDGENGIYIFGGRDPDNSKLFYFYFKFICFILHFPDPLNDLWYYDFTGTFTRISPAHTPTAIFSFASWGSIVYGGYTASKYLRGIVRRGTKLLMSIMPGGNNKGTNGMYEYFSSDWQMLMSPTRLIPPLPSPLQVPFSRLYANAWTDSDGNLWLYGGATITCFISKFLEFTFNIL